MRAIEISIILIIILVIFGVVLNSIENTTDKVINEVEANNMEKLASEVVDNLINNPGVPDNWNEYGKGTPGLAIVNEDGQIVPNSVSYSKLIALGKDYRNLVQKQLFDSKIQSSMELIPIKSSVSSVKIGDGNDEADNFFTIARIVKCDFYKNYVLKDFSIPGTCNKQHSQDKYSCNYFKVFPGNLKHSDYYLLVDDSEKYDLSYIIGSTRLVKDKPWSTIITDDVYLNNEIEFYDDSDAVIFIHLDKPHSNALLVSVPKNFDSDYLEYDYFKTAECKLIFKAWYS